MRNGRQKSTRQINCEVGMRAAITTPNKGGTDSTSYPTAPQRDGAGIRGIPQPRLTLLDVLPVLPATSATYEFVRIDGYLNVAAYQKNEGDEKAEGEVAGKAPLKPPFKINSALPAR